MANNPNNVWSTVDEACSVQQEEICSFWLKFI